MASAFDRVPDQSWRRRVAPDCVARSEPQPLRRREIPEITDFYVHPSGAISVFGREIGTAEEHERVAINEAHEAMRERELSLMLDQHVIPVNFEARRRRQHLPSRRAIRQMLDFVRRAA